MISAELLKKFQEIADHPDRQKEAYQDMGKKIVLMAPVYTPEEIVHSMGMVPMGIWGADMELKESKRYFPSFICSIMQSIVELGMKGAYEGAAAIIIPSLCDSLKVLGENWKYAVPSIPFIPMTYPQNRKPDYGKTYTKASYKRLIWDLSRISGASFEDDRLAASIQVYNEHNATMRELTEVLADNSSVSARQRNAVYKSAYFILKEEHTALVKELIKALREEAYVEPLKGTNVENTKIKIMTTGIISDCPSLLDIMEENNLRIVCDDVAGESRQYRTDAKPADTALDSLVTKFSDMDYCSVLYNVQKKRVNMIVETAKEKGARGVFVLLTKFCDPEEFDYPFIKKACEAEGLPVVLIEVDRQMVNYEQARTIVETFSLYIQEMTMGGKKYE